MDKDQQISELIIKVDCLAQRLEKTEKRIEELESVNTALRLENTKLKGENTELKMRLNSNSNNSSKPPSSDGYKKKPAFPKAKNGKQGGQNHIDGENARGHSTSPAKFCLKGLEEDAKRETNT